jgi:hypothetical protein
MRPIISMAFKGLTVSLALIMVAIQLQHPELTHTQVFMQYWYIVASAVACAAGAAITE